MPVKRDPEKERAIEQAVRELGHHAVSLLA